MRRSRDNDYNTARPGHWGEEAKTTYKAGDVIDVSWCVSADHGGIPQFRLCNDEGLVSAVTTPDKPPSLADLEALEQCFQRGLLRCDDVDGNDCSQVEVCGEYAADWGACADPGKYLHCRDEKGTEGKYWACVNTAETCDHGKMARYKLKIRESFPASTHTILRSRWRSGPGPTRASRPPRSRRAPAATAATGTRSRSRARSSGPTSATRRAPENGA